MDWTTACPDWAARLRAGQTIIPPPIFQARAEEALRVFRELRIVDAPGSPTFGECCAQWVFDLVASIFGAYDESTGQRLITEWFVLVPKKNSKSTIAAGIMMTAHILNWRQSAEFSIVAPTVEIASNSFSPARDMVQRDEELTALMHVQTHVKTITHRESGATLKVLAADAETVGGKKSVGTLVDELWLFGKRSDAENMLREATGGLASRPEGFTIYLSTQSDDPPAGIFAQLLRYARNVRDGVTADNRFVPVIYEFPKSMIDAGEHRDPKNFGMVNPNMGRSVDRGYIEREFAKADLAGEESMRGFLAKHLNVEVGLSLRSDRWAGADFWEAQGTAGLTLEALISRCEVLEVGIDGGGLDDLFGLAIMGRETGTGNWLHWGHGWAHPIVMDRRKSEAQRLQDFAMQGDLTIVGQIGQDIEQAVAFVLQAWQSRMLDKIGVDVAGIGAVVDALVAAGIPLDRIVSVSQGWKMAGAIKTAERKLAEGTLWHGGSPLMAWNVGNARVEPKGNAVMITKQVSGTAKIDLLMALLNGVALLSLNPQSTAPTEYLTFISGQMAPINEEHA